MSYIITASGEFDFDRIESNDIDIDDIARALSKMCRFTGHCQSFYSVAEHSVHVSEMVDPDYALEALLHDAHEAYVGDVSSPLKAMLPDYRAIEERVERHVRRSLGVPEEMSPDVRFADVAACSVEMAQLFTHHLPSIQPFFTLDLLKPADAYVRFMQRYEELT